MYTVYKTVNKIDNKYYIGVHKTDNPKDDYLGSGKYLKRAIEKYGSENFSKKILLITEDRQEAFAKEKELVNLKDPLSYNLKAGGEGGFDFINNHGLRASYKETENRKLAKSNNGKKTGSVNFKKAHKLKKINYVTFKGKSHTEETKKKMSLAASKRIGSKNSQYGTMWITNGTENTKIKKIDIIPEGWYKGRVI